MASGRDHFSGHLGDGCLMRWILEKSAPTNIGTPVFRRMISEATALTEVTGSTDQEECAVFVIFVGAPIITRVMPKADYFLLVEADEEKALQLWHNLRQRGDVTVCAEVLAEKKGTPVRWFRFNDPRMNGPLPADFWHGLYPNLQQTGEETLLAGCLEDVLNDWADRHERRQRLFLRLELRQGDPLPVLGGLGP